MRSICFLIVVVCAPWMMAGKHAQTAESLETNQLVGTWKLVSVRHGMEGNVGYPDLFNYADKQTLKHITPTHTVTVSYYKDVSVFKVSGGTYSLDSARYTETVEYGIDLFQRPLEPKGTLSYDFIVSGTTLQLTIRYGDKGKSDELWERCEGEVHDAAKPADVQSDEGELNDFSAIESETPDHTREKNTEPVDSNNQ